jgi:hypothetical protein
MSMSDIRKEIYALESSLLTPEIRASAEALDQLLSDDFFEFGSSGNAYLKKDTLSHVPKSAPAYNETALIQDFNVKELSPDCVLATYRSDITYADGERKHAYRSSIWMKENNRWRMLFHQGTPTAQ